MVEALWILTYLSVYCYKIRYETDSTSTKQASSNPDFTSGLTPARARLKKVTKQQFKVVNGVEFFEVHDGEWVRSHSSPVGPCKHAASMGSLRGIGSRCAPYWNDGIPVWPSALGSVERRPDWFTTTPAQGSTTMAPERFINCP